MEKLLSTIEEKGITRVKLFVVDIEGHPKFMIIPSSYLEEAVEGFGIDGSSIPGFTAVDKSDLIARPDLESAIFLEDEVAIFCDVEHEDRRVFEGDPRGILKKVLKKGTFYAKPELEFFLLRNGIPIDSKGYMDEAEGLIIAVETAVGTGIAIERIHHENGPGQYEIEPLMAPALRGCDQIVLLKEALKQKAKCYQMTATFMPKPLDGKAGSGMHIHILQERDGENLFENFDEYTRYFVGGILSHARGITALCNPTINSYRRLVHNFEAPVHISWGRGNRSTLVRIPQGGTPRVEYRSPDPMCNPYLALAVILESGLDGIKKGIKPPEEAAGNLFKSKKGKLLPATLEEALKELKKDTFVMEVLGEHIARKFVRLKEQEVTSYKKHISQWELDHYLT